MQATGFGAYIFFGAFCVIAFVYVWFFVPETKGKSLEEMDEVFNDHNGSDDVAKKERILQAVFDEKLGSRGNV